MSRLQVGGLALIIGFTKCDRNIGKTVKLISYYGTRSFDDGSVVSDLWRVSGDDLIWANGLKQDWCLVQSKYLMPLGDKQTQDEFKKELDLCHEN